MTYQKFILNHAADRVLVFHTVGHKSLVTPSAVQLMRKDSLQKLSKYTIHTIRTEGSAIPTPPHPEDALMNYEKSKDILGKVNARFTHDTRL